MHTNIATELLDHIKTRKLDLFFEMEDKIISRTSLVRHSQLIVIPSCDCHMIRHVGQVSNGRHFRPFWLAVDEKV